MSKENPYRSLLLGVSIGVHQDPVKPTNLVAFLTKFLNWQEMLSLALVFYLSSRAPNIPHNILVYIMWKTELHLWVA